MNSGIYIIINKTNGHRYVGSSINLKKRWNIHCQRLRKKTHDNAYLQNAWNKYSEDAFAFEVLEEWEPEFLVSAEQWWMNMLCPEYNIAPVAGSNLGARWTLSTETRAKMSAAKIGYKHSEKAKAKMSAAKMGHKASRETRAKMSAQRKGRKLPPRSDEHRAKLSAAGMGRKQGPHSAEHRAKLSAAGKRRTFSKEHRARISAAKMGQKISKETRDKLSAAMKGKPWSPARRAAQEAKCIS